MLIHLVGSTPELYRLCSDILAETAEAGHFWTLAAVSPETGRGEADVCIWDIQPDVQPPQNGDAKPPLSHIFLVEPKDLETLERKTGTADGNVVLKPVRRQVLARSLAAAMSSSAVRKLRKDRDEILQCLIEANLKLQEYDRERAAFLGRAAHDFQSSLTALSGYCGLLLSEPLGPLNGDQNEILRRMQNSAKRLSRMASGIFDFSAGTMMKPPDLQPGDLKECVQQALHEIAPFTDEKAISITADLDAGEEGLYFEAAQIEQVLINILDNACRFTPRTGSIEIRGYPYFWERRARQSTAQAAIDRRRRSSREPNSYRVDVSDSGAPLPAARPESVFDEHAASANGRERSGGGLGLSICKVILSQHQGRMLAENRDGCPVFSFVLPTHKSDPRLPAPGAQEDASGRGSSNGS